MTPNPDTQRLGKRITAKEAAEICRENARRAEEGLNKQRERDAEEARCSECTVHLSRIEKLEDQLQERDYAIGWFVDRYEKMGEVNLKTAHQVFSSLTPHEAPLT